MFIRDDRSAIEQAVEEQSLVVERLRVRDRKFGGALPSNTCVFAEPVERSVIGVTLIAEPTEFRSATCAANWPGRWCRLWNTFLTHDTSPDCRCS